MVEVALRPVEASGVAALRDWTLTADKDGTRQVLRLDLQTPTSERMLAVLTCRPKKALTRQPVLRFPRPLATGANAGPDAIYALRARDAGHTIAIDAVSHPGLVLDAPESLLHDKEWSRVLDRRLDNAALLHVYRPAAAGTPELRPTLRPSITTTTAELETTWQVEPRRAIAAGTIRWSGKEPLSVLEFTLSGTKVVEVRGPELGEWRQSAGRVSIWLRKPAAAGQIEWLGATPSPPPGQAPPVPFAFDAAVPRLLEVKAASEKVHIQPVEGWMMTVERDRGWTALPQAGSAQSFQAGGSPTAPVHVSLSPAPIKPVPDAGAAVPVPGPRPTAGRVAPVASKSAAPASPKPSLSFDAAPSSTPPWLVAAVELLGWCAAIVVLAFLMVRLPRTTWPEQLALLACLFGAVVAGHWWFGLCAWPAARIAWLAERVLSRQR